jgi:hypothetical protein
MIGMLRVRIQQLAEQGPLLLLLIAAVFLLVGCPGGDGGGY